MKHVELIGVAGSGKSTVARELLARNQAINSLAALHGTVTARLLFPGPTTALGERLPPKALSYLARGSGLTDRAVNFFSLQYPEMLPATARYARTYTTDTERIEYVSGAVLDLVEKYGAVDEHASLLSNESSAGPLDSLTGEEKVPADEPVLLVDEGFAFAVAAVLHPPQKDRLFTPEDLRDYVSTLPIPDVIVFVRASPAVCVARMQERASGVPASWERLDADSYVDHATEAVTVAETIAEAFESRGTRIVEVNTDDQSVDRSVSEVERKLSVSVVERSLSDGALI